MICLSLNSCEKNLPGHREFLLFLSNLFSSFQIPLVVKRFSKELRGKGTSSFGFLTLPPVIPINPYLGGEAQVKSSNTN